MTLLLDTHVPLSPIGDPPAISGRARSLIVEPGNTIVESSASALEIATKHRLGRLRAEELATGARHAVAVGALPGPHRDPYDRVLAMRALHQALPLRLADLACAAGAAG